jgi:cyanophycin synthetase
VRLEQVRHLGGPNIFSTGPVSIARLELEELTGRETTSYPGFNERLVMALPGLRDHHCAAGQPGGYLQALDQGTYFGHVAEHVTLELSGLAGREVHLGRTMWAGADGRYDVMTECPVDEPADSAVPGELLALAIGVVTELLAKHRPDFAVRLAAIARVAERERLGPSTAAIAAAARSRGIAVRRVGGLSLLRLGYGCHRQLLSAALTGQTSALGVDIACDKVLAKQLLAAAGIPVPEGGVVHDVAEAVEAFGRIGAPAVIKPRNGNHGRCVTVGVRSPAQTEHAYRRAAAGSGSAEVILEAYVPGNDFRVLVIDGKVSAAAHLRPPVVTGDGVRTIGELIEELNADPLRGDGHNRALTKVSLDDAVLAHLAAQGLDPATVPAPDQEVSLRRNGNLSTGGTSKDVTGLVHPDIAELCRRAAHVAGLDVCGIDLRCEDIAAPLIGHGRPGAAVIEVNASPGLRMHLTPTEGQARDVAGAIVDKLFPPGAKSRIPIVSVTGTNGKTTTTRMIAHILRQAGLRTGMTCTDGVWIGDRCILEADASGPRSAEIVLDDPTVEAAVLETARGGIIRRGLGYDLADVAVVTNISDDHIGDDGMDDISELTEVKALVAEEVRAGGNVVLNADDPATAALGDRPRVRGQAPAIRYFSLAPGGDMIGEHARSGGACYLLDDGQLTETAGGSRRAILSVADLPGAFSGRARHVVANALAAIAACRALGVSVKDIAQALTTFAPAAVNLGRGNVYAVTPAPSASTATAPVLLDYAHNAAALRATGELVASVWGTGGTAAVTLPGDRRGDLIAESAAAVAAWFGRVVVYEDEDLRGRAPGEMRELVAAELRRARPSVEISHADGPHDALRTAVNLAAGGPVLFLYEKLDQAMSALASLGATPWPEEDLMGLLGAAEPVDTEAADAVLADPTAADKAMERLLREVNPEASDSDTMPLPSAGSAPAVRLSRLSGPDRADTID